MPIYSDINQYDPTSMTLLHDASSVYQSIDNILSTPVRQRLFNRPFGGILESLLFELMTERTAASIYHEVASSVRRYEPRVILLESQCMVEPVYDENLYRLRLVFQIRGLGDEVFSYNANMQKSS